RSDLCCSRNSCFCARRKLKELFDGRMDCSKPHLVIQRSRSPDRSSEGWCSSITRLEESLQQPPNGWVNGKLLGKKKYSNLQLKLLDNAMPMLKHIDKLWP